ncbi:MAG TPA: hypothetical protein PKC98_26005, partial [Candidatus Melainabacteria bacterium]|nr:hypothetical protein [Candidatus Melainabacteria bacterium]
HMLNEMMTVKADDIQGRHQAYADIVQGKNPENGGRTAAFDGLCCEIRALGLEMTLGKVVDTFEELPDKFCSHKDLPEDPTMEEKLQVSSVDMYESATGEKLLEIPAGDYEPVVRPPQVPMITSITNGKNGKKPQIELAKESLIDDIDEPGNNEAENVEETKDVQILDDFINTVTSDLNFAPDQTGFAEQEIAIPASTQVGETNELSSLIAPELDQDDDMVDFPSLSELKSLAQELMGISTEKQAEGEKEAMVGFKATTTKTPESVSGNPGDNSGSGV